MHPSSEHPSTGQSKYRVVEPLKTGGTAAIYLAVMRGENRFTREVVIKRPLPHLLADRRLRAMFVDEAMIAARLSHPNIVQVIDLVDREDEVFLVLEFLKGADLREIIKRCRELGRLIPIELGVWMGAEVCSGLDFAHNATSADGAPLNLVHRDISPKNVRVTDNGAVKVIDFGIARAENRVTETAPGSVKGTLGYMSPEQVMGEAIDRRSDIFAVGILLFQVLTGRNPFDAKTLKDRVQRLIHAPIPRASEFNPELDDVIDQIIAKCLERDIDARYQRASEIESDLSNWLAKQQIAAPRERMIEFLEEIFPKIHELPKRLREVLTSYTGSSSDDELASWGAPVRLSESPDGASSVPTIQSSSNAPPEAAFSAWAGDPASAFGGGPPPMSAPGSLPPPGVAPAAHASGSADSVQTVTHKRSPPNRLMLVAGVLLFVVAGLALWGAGRMSATPQFVVSTLDPPSKPAVPIKAEDPTAVVDTKPPQDAVPSKAPRKHVRPDAPSKAVVRKKPPPKKATAARPTKGRLGRARKYLKTGLHLSKQGNMDDALFMYQLAYAHSGQNPNPAIYRNLALVHRQLGAAGKVRSCFNLYLEARPGASDAGQIRALLSASASAKPVPCVSGNEAAGAKKRARRVGAVIDAWVRDAGADG